jgi:threonyl-tRNA synthetase
MAQNIQITLPDGSKKEVPSGTTPLDIARSISPRLADAALVAKIKPKPSAASSQPEQNGGPAGQLSTVQFDFNLPARFNLEYVAEDGTRKQPVMVHRALFGSVERFFGVLIEHFAGAFPVWLSPVQVAVIPISEKHVDYANKVAEQLKAAGVRVHVDDRNEKMNAKVREQTMQKVPFLLVVGEKEAEAGTVNVRVRGQQQPEGTYPATEFVERVKKLIATKAVSLA